MTYCETKKRPKGSFDKRSFRWISRGDVRMIIGCPKGKWSPGKGRCKVGTKAYVVLRPAKKGKRCPVGSKRIRK